MQNLDDRSLITAEEEAGGLIIGVPHDDNDDGDDSKPQHNNNHHATNKPTVEYRRIASTLSSQHSTTTPWDLIQDDNAIIPSANGTIIPPPWPAQLRSVSATRFSSKGPSIDPVLEDDDNTLLDDDNTLLDDDNTADDGNAAMATGLSNRSDDGSDFSLDSAWSDVQQLPAHQQTDNNSSPQIIKPSNELRDLLLFYGVPSNVIRDVLTSLQLRDNWLAFLSKHFRRTLKTIMTNHIHNDHRFHLLKELLADFKPYHQQSESPHHSNQSTSNISSAVHSSPGDERRKPSIDKSCYIPVLNSSGIDPPLSQPDDGTFSHYPKQNPRKKRNHPVYIVTSVLAQHKTLPSCISLVSRQLGLDPNEHSGLKYFSPSCEQRALLEQSRQV